MADLNALIIFAKVVEAKSFSEAARRLKLPISLRVFGCLPDTGARGCTEAGVRKASREETAGEFATVAQEKGERNAIYCRCP